VQQLQSWLSLKPNVTAAYQLAVQLAAMDLNVLSEYFKAVLYNQRLNRTA
jgi:hypothetical protein